METVRRIMMVFYAVTNEGPKKEASRSLSRNFMLCRSVKLLHLVTYTFLKVSSLKLLAVCAFTTIHYPIVGLLSKTQCKKNSSKYILKGIPIQILDLKVLKTCPFHSFPHMLDGSKVN
jgi:hypothetical protein